MLLDRGGIDPSLCSSARPFSSVRRWECAAALLAFRKTRTMLQMTLKKPGLSTTRIAPISTDPKHLEHLECSRQPHIQGR